LSEGTSERKLSGNRIEKKTAAKPARRKDGGEEKLVYREAKDECKKGKIQIKRSAVKKLTRPEMPAPAGNWGKHTHLSVDPSSREKAQQGLIPGAPRKKSNMPLKACPEREKGSSIKLGTNSYGSRRDTASVNPEKST